MQLHEAQGAVPPDHPPGASPRGRWFAVLRASAVLLAFGVGAGVLGVPALVARAGIGVAAAVFLIGTSASVLMHLWVGRVAQADPKRRQLAELIFEYAFQGQNARIATGIFVLFTAGNIGLMAGYWSGASEVVAAGFGAELEPWAARLLSFALLGGIALLPRKGLPTLQLLGIILLFATLVSLAAFLQTEKLSMTLPRHHDLASFLPLLAVYMFCLSSLFAVPQAIEGLGEHTGLARYAVIGGQFGNVLVILIISVTTLLVTADVPAVALLAWQGALPAQVASLAGVFSLAALATSYWGTHHAVAKMVEDRLRWSPLACSAVVAGATVAIAAASTAGFLTFLTIAGALPGLLVAFLMIPALLRVERLHHMRPTPRWVLGFVMAVYTLMLLGAAV